MSNREVSYSDVVRAYDKIITQTNSVENWRELIPTVSERTGAESEFVEECLNKLFIRE